MSEGNVIQTDTYDFDDRIDSPAVFVFFCDHTDHICRAVEPIIEEVAAEYENDVVFLSVDAEQSPELFARYSVEGVPYVIMFRHGEPTADLEGANLPNVYIDLIEASL